MYKNKKDINIEFLFLDFRKCKRCMDTDSSLENAVSKLSKIIKYKGVKLNIK